MHKGEKIRISRESVSPKLTQEHLADRVGIKRSRLAQYEAGRTNPPAHILSKIAEVTGRPLSWFFEDDPTLGGAIREAMQGWSRSAGTVSLPLWPEIPRADFALPYSPKESVSVPAFLQGSNHVIVQVSDPLGAPNLTKGDKLVVVLDSAPRVGRMTLAVGDGGLSLALASRRDQRTELVSLDSKRAPLKGDWECAGYVVAVLRDYTNTRGMIEWDEGGIGI